jgi:hypothetical protein
MSQDEGAHLSIKEAIVNATKRETFDQLERFTTEDLKRGDPIGVVAYRNYDAIWVGGWDNSKDLPSVLVVSS